MRESVQVALFFIAMSTMPWGLGVACGYLWKTGIVFVERHEKEPYCRTTSIADREYKRCWKAVEVPP